MCDCDMRPSQHLWLHSALLTACAGVRPRVRKSGLVHKGFFGGFRRSCSSCRGGGFAHESCNSGVQQPACRSYHLGAHSRGGALGQVCWSLVVFWTSCEGRGQAPGALPVLSLGAYWKKLPARVSRKAGSTLHALRCTRCCRSASEREIFSSYQARGLTVSLLRT